MILMSSTFGRGMATHALGAIAAAFVWLPVAVLVIGPGDPMGVALGIAGLIVSPLVAILLTDRAVASHGLGAWVAIRFAFVSVFAGAFLFGLFFAAAAGHSLADAIGFGLLGLVFLGIPMFILGFNLALLWVAVVRWVAAG